MTDSAEVTPSGSNGKVGLRFGLASKILAAAFGGMMLTVVIAVAIWPGEMKLLAPLFCTEAQPDAFVVTDSYQVQPGETSYNFSLYCMGPRGDVTNVGVWKPYGTLFLFHTAIVLVLFVLPSRGRGAPRPRSLAGSRSQSTLPAGSTAGPFVD